MISEFSSYKVKIRDNKFISTSGIEFTHTACISFFDNSKKELFYTELGYMDDSSIYELIRNGSPVNLDNCYIEGLSFAKYRKLYQLENEELITVLSFSAKDSFFEAVPETDLSFALFSGNSVSFQNAVFMNGGVNFNSSVFEQGKVTFNSCRFINGNLNFSNVNFGHGGLNFKNVTIGEGTKDFQYAFFGNGDVFFANTSFGNGDVSFINANFGNGEVSFKVCSKGKGKLDFHFATFGEGDISFERAEFGSGKVDFRTVEFGKGKINFNKAVFSDGDISFDESEMQEGKLTFKGSCFGNGDFSFSESNYSNSDLSFERAVFGSGVVSFYKSRFRSLSLKSCQLNNHFDLRIEETGLLDLNDTVVRDIIDLTPHDFEVNIKKISLKGMRLLGRMYLDWRSNHVKSMIYSTSSADYWSMAEQFRTLKQNFNSTGRYDDEDLAYIEFKRNESKAILSDSLKANNKSAIVQYPVYWFKLWVFDRMGLYATSPTRVLFSVFVTLLGFSFIQFIFPFLFSTEISGIPTDGSLLLNYLNTLYFSGITFFTIGYGDCSPKGILQPLSIIEGFTGVFMMAYFTVAFARKVLR